MSLPSSIKSFDGTTIYYEIDLSPHKKYLVFLHGLGGDLTAWNKERDGFRKLGYKTLALDLRGHGLSGRPKHIESYNMEYFTNDVIEILKKEKIEKPVIIGHCFGGMVTIALEGIHPGTSQALVLVDTSYKSPYFSGIVAHNILLNKIVSLITKHTPKKHLLKHTDYSKFFGTSDFDLKRILNDILHTSLRSYLLSVENILSYDAKTLLGKISVPTLIVEGANDLIFPPKVAEDLASRIKTAELDFIPNANHILVLNNPLDLVTTITRFLKKIRF